tara:strand:- start:119 stop:376 length:258 start_codon:yes stop_codon:yes gene_type:complete
MKNILYIFSIIIIFIFFYLTAKTYLSEKNINKISENRLNVFKLLDDKTSNLPILSNDTNNVIKFNDGFININEKKNRKFWELFNK